MIFELAPKAECRLPILCTNLTHCARNQNTEWAETADVCAGLPRDLNAKLPAKTAARLRAVFCLLATTEAELKHQTKERRSKAFNAAHNGAPTRASGGRRPRIDAPG